MSDYMSDELNKFDDGLADYVNFDVNCEDDLSWLALNLPRTACRDIGVGVECLFPKVEKPTISWGKLGSSTLLVHRIRNFVNLVKSFVDNERETVAERVFRCCMDEMPDEKDTLHFGPHIDDRDGIDDVYDDLITICGEDKDTLAGISNILDEIVFRLYITRVYRDAKFENSEDFVNFYSEYRGLFQVTAPLCFFTKWLKTCASVDEFLDVFTIMIDDGMRADSTVLGALLKSRLSQKEYPFLLKKLAMLMSANDKEHVLFGFYQAFSEYCENADLFKNGGGIECPAL
ncbi:MAG TPA: hypothetical protein PK398_01075 [Candidatus Gracilibacteria bacterium]|nr:hypothetical protein [Candidatus Gracilibacteria bacterium]